MAAAITNSAQTGSTATNKLPITSATAGRKLVVAIGQTGTKAAPKISDNVNGETGWTVEEVHSLNAGSANSIYFAHRNATGGETELTATAGGSGTVQGMDAWEASGMTEEVDASAHIDNLASASSAELVGFSTATAGAVVFACAGVTGAQTGEIKPWEGTGPLNRISAESSRVVGGSLVTTGTLSAAHFNAVWTTAKTCGMVVFAFKPSAEGGATPVPLIAAASQSAASAEATAPTQVPVTAALSTASAALSASAPTRIPLIAAASQSAASLGVTAPTVIPLAGAMSTSAASLELTVPSTGVPIPLLAALSTSAASAALKAKTRVALTPAASQSAALASLSAPTQVLVLPGASTSGASLTITLGGVTPQFPAARPLAGHVAVSQVGRLARQVGRTARPQPGQIT